MCWIVGERKMMTKDNRGNSSHGLYCLLSASSSNRKGECLPIYPYIPICMYGFFILFLNVLIGVSRW